LIVGTDRELKVRNGRKERRTGRETLGRGV
jgi:hypothetical protein